MYRAIHQLEYVFNSTFLYFTLTNLKVSAANEANTRRPTKVWWGCVIEIPCYTYISSANFIFLGHLVYIKPKREIPILVVKKRTFWWRIGKSCYSFLFVPIIWLYDGQLINLIRAKSTKKYYFLGKPQKQFFFNCRAIVRGGSCWRADH